MKHIYRQKLEHPGLFACYDESLRGKNWNRADARRRKDWYWYPVGDTIYKMVTFRPFIATDGFVWYKEPEPHLDF